MNFLPSLILLYFFLKSSVYAAVSSSGKVLECEELVLRIGSFLALPEMNFGLMNKINYEIFYKNFKFKLLAQEFFSTPEPQLLTYNSYDLMFFEELGYISDDYYLIASVVHFLCTQSVFTPNGKVIGRYVLKKIRTLRNSGELNLEISKFKIIRDQFVTFLILIRDFKSLLQLLEIYPEALENLYYLVDETIQLVFFKELMINYNSGTELQIEFLQKTFVEEFETKSGAFSTFNIVNFEFFYKKLSNCFLLFTRTFEIVFFKTFSSSFSADQMSFRFHNIRNYLYYAKKRVKSQSKDKNINTKYHKNQLELFYLINEIRFGPEDEELYEKKIQIKNKHLRG